MKKLTTAIATITFMLMTGLFTYAQQSSSAGNFYTSFDGVKIHYEVNGDGFPVVLIHGFTGDGTGWKRSAVYNDLLKAGYKVVILDQRGNGQSDKPHSDAAYANGAEIKDVTGLVSSLGIKQYDIVGYSRGSIIASSLLVQDKRVRKVVMGGMGDGYTDPNWPRRVHAYKALMGDTSFHDVDGLMKYVNSNHFDNVSLMYQQKYQPSTSKEELAKVTKPVLIIRGTEDKENGSEIELNKMIPGSKLVYTPGDHGAASNTPQFSAAVLGFLK